MYKRSLSMLLALLLCLALLPAGAAAAEEEFVIDENGVLLEYNGPGGDVVIPDGVKAVSASAFQYSTEYGWQPRRGFRSITSLTVPEGCLAIGVTQITFSSNGHVSSISQKRYDRMMRACSSLKEVNLPRTLEVIGGFCFEQCENLERVNFPSGYGNLTIIGDSAFWECTSLKSFTCPQRNPEDLKYYQKVVGQSDIGTISYRGGGGYIGAYFLRIDTGAFYGCKSLERVTLTAGVPCKIDDGAFGTFQNCGKLETIENGESIYYIGNNAFDKCTALRNLTVSDDLDSQSLSLLQNTPWYENRYNNQEFAVSSGALVKYNGAASGEVVIPGNLGIRIIGDCGFRGSGITGVVIPEGVEEIDASAFAGCKSLKSVTLPKSLQYIGTGAFGGCTALEGITLPENTFYVDEGAFRGCSGLREIGLEGETVFACSYNGETPVDGTPYLTALLRDQANSDFVMLGVTLIQYQGSGGDVVLPENTRWVTSNRSVFVGSETVTSITYPVEMKAWLDGKLAQNSRESADTAIKVNGYVSINSNFTGCTRLQELINAPYPYSVWPALARRMVKWQVYRRAWVDPADCLAAPGERITAQSNAIVSAAGASDDYAKARAIADWVAKNVKYDVGVYRGTKSAYDAVIDPEGILDGAPTICDGYTRLTNALLRAQGIPANYIAGTANGGSHAWTEAWLDGRWVNIDTTWMAPFMNGTDEQGYEPKYFDMGLFEFAGSHQIEERSNLSRAGDLPSGWAEDETFDAIAAGVVPHALQGGYQANITRQEFCQVMMALMAQATGQAAQTSGASPFTDTDDPAVAAAHALGIVNGVTETTFNPNGSITRQEAAAMLARTARVLGLTPGAAQSFNDAGQIAGWAREGVDFVSGLVDPTGQKAVMGGTGEGNFSPLGTYTREQAYITAVRLFNCK